MLSLHSKELRHNVFDTLTQNFYIFKNYCEPQSVYGMNYNGYSRNTGGRSKILDGTIILFHNDSGWFMEDSFGNSPAPASLLLVFAIIIGVVYFRRKYNLLG